MMYEPNIVELAAIKYRILHILPFSSILSVSVLLVYLAYRLRYMVTTYNDNADFPAVCNSGLYFIAEIGLLFPAFLNHLLRCLAVHGRKKAQHLRLLDNDDPPRVDVFITCAGEDHDTVKNTAEAACAIDYPAHRFRVIVLDDAGSQELSKSIRTLAKTRPNCFYTARVKGKNHHFKAGNLNHGVDYVNSLPGGPSEYIAALDADMIPDPQWLRALLPHMLKNSKLALAQTPQRFYDVPTDDPLMQGLDVNFKVTEPLKETMGSTWCGGSGYILRRAALDDIGGFPTESVGEDMYCSNILLGKGWDALYIDETLQSGRVPESYKAHVKQQSRWHVGRVQTAIAMRFYLYGEHARKMDWRQRSIGLIYVSLSFCNIITTVGMGTLLISIASGLPLVSYANEAELHTLVCLVCACIVTEWLDDCVVGLITGYRIAISEGHINCWIAPYHAVALIQAFLPKWLQDKTFEFTPSGSANDPKQKPLPGHDIAGLRRVLATLRTENVGFHLLYIVLCGASLARSSSLILQRAPHPSTSAFAFDVVVHIAWPPVLWLVCLNSFSVPIRCAFRPPSIPNRAQLLKKDPVRRASYPRDVSEAGEDKVIGSQTLCYSLVMVYVFGLAAYTLWSE